MMPLIRARRFWLPHPLFSLFLALLWLLMVNDVSMANALLGLALGVAIPMVTHGFWAEEARIRRPLPLLRYLLVLLLDILRSNLVVALRILRPARHLKPAFFIYPLTLDDDFAITILASTISLTPGTVSLHHDAEANTLLVHALHLENETEAIEEIHRRYERPLQEIFR
ncbi:Na+/H+ antiporter subunit E [uncultured Halomonas sp.]|uniref:Na+/H+ antiporter subunit E n=1 Tax=uncultured Halomonas sp. TaxID=173971 RepID=UPI00262BDA39|nr:Na+/H+ antiporter subunit E [uncultured Halomonas sp.]